jgi:ParB-like chromosome segregation protein Spo0J
VAEQVELDNLTPLHEPREIEHVRNLADDMKENGWIGRPLLVIERESDFLAWTGSHRIAAAKLAGLKTIPCYVVQESELTSRGFQAEHGHVMDYERLEILKEVGNEVAIHIMWQENRS